MEGAAAAKLVRPPRRRRSTADELKLAQDAGAASHQAGPQQRTLTVTLTVTVTLTLTLTLTLTVALTLTLTLTLTVTLTLTLA